MPSLNDQFTLLGLKINEEKASRQETVAKAKDKVSQEDYYLSQSHKNKKKVSITIDWDLYEKLNDKARKENRSFSSLLSHCASLGLKNLNETRIF